MTTNKKRSKQKGRISVLSQGNQFEMVPSLDIRKPTNTTLRESITYRKGDDDKNPDDDSLQQRTESDSQEERSSSEEHHDNEDRISPPHSPNPEETDKNLNNHNETTTTEDISSPPAVPRSPSLSRRLFGWSRRGHKNNKSAVVPVNEEESPPPPPPTAAAINVSNGANTVLPTSETWNGQVLGSRSMSFDGSLASLEKSQSLKETTNTTPTRPSLFGGRRSAVAKNHELELENANLKCKLQEMENLALRQHLQHLMEQQQQQEALSLQRSMDLASFTKELQKHQQQQQEEEGSSGSDEATAHNSYATSSRVSAATSSHVSASHSRVTSSAAPQDDESAQQPPLMWSAASIVTNGSHRPVGAVVDTDTLTVDEESLYDRYETSSRVAASVTGSPLKKEAPEEEGKDKLKRSQDKVSSTAPLPLSSKDDKSVAPDDDDVSKVIVPKEAKEAEEEEDESIDLLNKLPPSKTARTAASRSVQSGSLETINILESPKDNETLPDSNAKEDSTKDSSSDKNDEEEDDDDVANLSTAAQNPVDAEVRKSSAWGNFMCRMSEFFNTDGGSVCDTSVDSDEAFIRCG